MTNIDDYLDDFVGYNMCSSDVKSLNSDYEGIVRLHGALMMLNKIDIESGSGSKYYSAIKWVLDDNSDVGSLRMACELLGKNYEVACEDYFMMDPNGDFRKR
jgi:hypothetical protein